MAFVILDATPSNRAVLGAPREYYLDLVLDYLE